MDVEKKIQHVVANVMESVVAVTDQQGAGSGVVVSPDGLILTAGHVMASRSGEYEIIFPSGRTAKAKAIGKNLSADAGMLQITDPGPWPYVEIENEEQQVGDWVITLGHSGGYELGRKPPVRTGRILAKRDSQYVTDAVLIGGDSGGPLFNLDGKLVGIHSSIGDSVAENRHVTIPTFRRDWVRMQRGETWGELPELSGEKKESKRARMGIVVDRTASNARILKVHPGSPAERAGILAGDVVTRFDNVEITDSVQLIELIKEKRPGRAFNVEVRRNNNYLKVLVELEVFKN